mgnify:FL=1
MTLEELQELADKDLKINDVELDLESLKTPQLHNKYCKFLNKFKTLQKQAEIDYNRLMKEKWEYYTGKADPATYQAKPFNLKILKQDVDKYIQADEDIIRSTQKLSYLNTVVDYLDRTIRLISNRGFTIKNAIDWKKFIGGVI